MAKIQGIKTVDFIIRASGEGVVNHNGAMSVFNPAAEKYVDNHLFPKLRGIDPLRKAVSKTDPNKSRGLSLADPELANAALIVSANCVRSHIFKTASFGVSEVTRDMAGDALASLHGLMRGYLITESNASLPRKSPLHMTDLECAKPGLRYNQGSKAGERSETSIFSFFATDKDLQYVGKGSISIEDLQFIPLESTHGRSAFQEVVSEAQGQLLAEHVSQFLQDLSGNPEAKAEFLTNARRHGSFSKVGEAGLLLNQAALGALVEETLDLIRNLYIRQSKGYLRVDEVVVDYNSGHAFRVIQDESLATPKQEDYAVYYYQAPLTPEAFADKMKKLESKEKEAKAAKRDKVAAKKTAKTAAATAAEATEDSASNSEPAQTPAQE